MYKPTNRASAATRAFRRRLRRTTTPDTLLTFQQVARYVGVSWAAVHKAAKAGHLPIVRPRLTLFEYGRRIARRHADAWIKRRRPTRTKPKRPPNLD